MQVNAPRFGQLSGKPTFKPVIGVNTLMTQHGTSRTLGQFKAEAFKLPGLEDKFYANFDGIHGFVHCNVVKSTGKVEYTGEQGQPSVISKNLTAANKAELLADTLALRDSFEARDNSGDYAKAVANFRAKGKQ